jgi:hypothetical protein
MSSSLHLLDKLPQIHGYLIEKTKDGHGNKEIKNQCIWGRNVDDV